jgi:hypothetical protein
MSWRWFNAWTGSQRDSRRVVLRALAGVPLGWSRSATGSAATRCKRVRLRCDTSQECCGDLVCRHLEVPHGCRRGRRCCVKSGGRCHDICDCCGDTVCDSGICD